MRTLLFLTIVLIAGCSRTPDQQQTDQLRSDATNGAAAIEKQANAEADRLEQRAAALGEQAKQAGGYTGKRLEVRADALTKEGRIIRDQADQQADAVKQAANARIKAFESR
jgi:hypothetical protein